MTTYFFEFYQNNSSGSDVIDESRGIGKTIIIEATDANHANMRAEQIGLYWDGCSKGIDCPCCGDRWTKLWPDEAGEDEPHLSLDWAIPVFVHYLPKGFKKL